jgi:hypothetical protein
VVSSRVRRAGAVQVQAPVLDPGEHRQERDALRRGRRDVPGRAERLADERLGDLHLVCGHVLDRHRGAERGEERGDPLADRPAVDGGDPVVGDRPQRRREGGLAQEVAGPRRPEDRAQAGVGGDRVLAVDDRAREIRRDGQTLVRERRGGVQVVGEGQRRAHLRERVPAGGDPRHGDRVRALARHAPVGRADGVHVDADRRGARGQDGVHRAVGVADEGDEIPAQVVLVRVRDDERGRRGERDVQRVAARCAGGVQRGGVRRGEGGSHAPKPSSKTVRAGAASLPTSLIGSAAST